MAKMPLPPKFNRPLSFRGIEREFSILPILVLPGDFEDNPNTELSQG